MRQQRRATLYSEVLCPMGDRQGRGDTPQAISLRHYHSLSGRIIVIAVPATAAAALAMQLR